MTDIQRKFVYFESGAETLFGWLHTTDNSEASHLAAVICNPLGVEYMSGHRSIRHLADQLSESGIPTLRFDYGCTGDSTGGEFRNVTILQIVCDIRNAVDTIRSATGASQIAVIGIGLGATFAAMASSEDGVDPLVLWNPTVSGRRFIREQRLLSEVLDQDNGGDTGAIDSAGLYLTDQLQDQFRSINLTEFGWNRAGPVLLISRSDMDSHRQLIQTLSGKVLHFEHTALPGYKEMMDQPTDTFVPFDTIESICAWLGRNKSGDQDVARNGGKSVPMPFSRDQHVLIPKDDFAAIELRELPAWFGSDNHLFGIATMPRSIEQKENKKRAFVFLNCGSEHHAGPHRLYTVLCRRIASHGDLTFRFDLEGIGDSVSIGNNEENNSYSRIALDDIDQALHYLTLEYGCNEFILCGICAGAYHAFKAAAGLLRHNIKEANLVNPLVFEWNYDDPENHLKYDVHTYRSAIRNPRDWWRLFSGNVDYRRLIGAMSKHLAESTRHACSSIARIMTRSTPTGLPQDLQTLRKLRRPLTLILSEGDPGLDIMKLQARPESRAALRDGGISVRHLAKSNHGLSKKYMQDQLVSTIVDKYYLDRDIDEQSES